MKISHDYFAKLWKEGDAGAAGICLQPIYRVTATDKPLETYWTDIPYGAKQLSHEELIKLNRSCNKNYKYYIYANNFFPILIYYLFIDRVFNLYHSVQSQLSFYRFGLKSFKILVENLYRKKLMV